jgi:hypothetical protein
VVVPSIVLSRALALENAKVAKWCGDLTFLRGMALIARGRAPLMTEAQIAQINRLAHKYRKQIDPELVPKK